MNDQGWYIKLLEIFGEICLGECINAVVGVFVTGLHSLEPEYVYQ